MIFYPTEVMAKVVFRLGSASGWSLPAKPNCLFLMISNLSIPVEYQSASRNCRGLFAEFSASDHLGKSSNVKKNAIEDLKRESFEFNGGVGILLSGRIRTDKLKPILSTGPFESRIEDPLYRWLFLRSGDAEQNITAL
jgi:hypothetical protein